MTRDLSTLPVVHQDPTDTSFVSNPYATYASWRAKGDFVYWADYEMAVATTHAAVSQVMRHPKMGRATPAELVTSENPDLSTWNALERHSLLELEAPDHTRLRREATKAFAGPQIALIAPKISQFADTLIDAFPTEPVDLIDAYCKPLAAMTITEFLGVDTNLAKQLQDWSNDMVAMYQARRDGEVEQKAEAAARAFSSFMRETIEDRRHTPGEDFLSQLTARQKTGGLSEGELISTAILLLNAGHEATVHATGNSVPLLCDFEGRAEALAPECIAGTVEECLRLRPPLHMFHRFAYDQIQIEDASFDANQKVGCLLASANRDDAVWPDGGVFDPFRSRRRHLAFGVGIHSCVGAALARLEMQISLPLLFARCPKLRIESPPNIANLYHFHGFERLEVSVR